MIVAKVTARAEVVNVNQSQATLKDNRIELPDSDNFSAGTAYVLEVGEQAKTPEGAKRFVLVVPGPTATTDAPTFEVGQEYLFLLHQDLSNDLKEEKLMLHFKDKCEELRQEHIFLAVGDRDATTSVTRENRDEVEKLMKRLRTLSK